MKKVLSAIDKLNEMVGRIVSFILVFIILATFVEVILRYVFGSPTSWSNELCTMMFGIYIIMGGAYVHAHKGHVTMDILSSRFSPRTKALVDVLTYVFVISFLAALTIGGASRAIQTIKLNEHATTVWAPSLIPFRLALPIGAFLFGLQTIAQFIRDLLLLFNKGEV